MSYILDALKRAEAERERGRVPGLHTQAAPAPDTREAPPRNPRRAVPTPWLLAGTVVVALTALAWMLSPAGRATPPASAPASPAPSAPAVPATATAPVVPAPEASVTTPLPTRAQPILAPRAPTSPAPAPDVVNAPAAKRDIPSFASLSAEQRAQLPQLSISGASYSENPAHRLLIVNGQIAQEGQEVAPGLVLERIGLNEAVLNQQGLRFRIGY